MKLTAMIVLSAAMLAFPASALAEDMEMSDDGMMMADDAMMMSDTGCAEMVAMLQAEGKLNAEQAAQLSAGCTGSGYYAVAHTMDGMGASLAVGFGSMEKAEMRAMEKCEALDAGECGVLMGGHDM